MRASQDVAGVEAKHDVQTVAPPPLDHFPAARDKSVQLEVITVLKELKETNQDKWCTSSVPR